MDIFSLVGKIALSGGREVKSELEGIEGVVERSKGKLMALGTAFTALGAAGLAIVQTNKQLNTTLALTGVTLGLSKTAMQDLAIATADAGFELNDVAATFEILTRAGMRNTEEMQKSAKAFDSLGDAVGMSAAAVANILMPAFKSMKLEIPTTAEELDKFTWLTKNTTVDLSEFGAAMQYVAMYGSDLGIKLEDMIGIMAALEARGITGSAATLLFRTAVTQAKDGAVTLNEALGVTQEQIDGYREKMDKATGITAEYSKAADGQLTLMDKLKEAFSELTLKMSGFLEPLQPILVAMTTLGPILLFLSTATGVWVTTMVAAKVSAVALFVAVNVLRTGIIAWTIVTWALNAAWAAFGAIIAANPIGAIITLIALLVMAGIALWKNWDKVVEFFKGAWAKMKAFFLSGIEVLLSGLAKFMGWIPKLGDKIKDARDAIRNMIDDNKVKEKAEKVTKAVTKMADAMIAKVQEASDSMVESLKKGTEEAVKAANEAYEAEVDRIKKLYGDAEDAVESLSDAEMKLHEQNMQAFEDELDAAKKTRDERIDAAWAAYEAGLDIEAKKIQDQLDAIDAGTEAADRAIQVQTDAEKVAELQKKIQYSQSILRKAELEEELSDLKADIAQRDANWAAEDAKEALRLKMENIQDGIGDEAAALALARDAKITAAEQEVADLILTLGPLKATEETRHTDKLAALETEKQTALANALAVKDGLVSAYDLDLANFTKLCSDKETATTESVNFIISEYARMAAALGIAEPVTIEPPPSSTPTVPTAPVVLPPELSWLSDILNTMLNPPEGATEGYGHEVTEYQTGGPIKERTALYGLKSQRVYAMADAGESVVSRQGGGSVTIEMTDFNGRLLARAVAPHLVDLIRLRTGIKV